MKKVFAVLALLLCAFAVQAQTTPTQPTLQDLGFSTFSVTASALAIHGSGQTVAVSDLGQSLAFTANSSIRLDEILSSSDTNFSAYLAGAKYFLPAFKPLANTTLAPLQLYVSAEGGVTRVTPIGTGNPVNKPSARAMFGANWNPKVTGAASFNIFEVGYAYMPGLVASTPNENGVGVCAHNHFLTFSAGVKVSF